MLEKTLESPFDRIEIHSVLPKGNQSWIFIGRTDSQAETPILWPPNVKNWLIGKDPDAGKDWRWEEKGMTEEEIVGWRHQLNGHEFEQTPGVGDGQGGLAYGSPWGRKESDLNERLNWTDSVLHINFFWEFLRETLNPPALRHYWNVCEPEMFQVRWLWKAANPTNSLPLGRVLVSPTLTRCIPISSYRSC